MTKLGLSDSALGGHIGRSMMLVEMTALVQALPATAGKAEIVRAVTEDNALGKGTLSARKRSISFLRQLYGLDPARALFRVFWRFAHEEAAPLPQLCLACVYARDPQLRRSFELVRTLPVGAEMLRLQMEQHLEDGFPGRFNAVSKKSMAQNLNTTWTFGGHLSGRAHKIRTLPASDPLSAAYAMFAGYLSGLRGETLLNSPYGELVAPNPAHLRSALGLAAAKGGFTMKQAAGIVEFDFSNLLTREELALLHESR